MVDVNARSKEPVETVQRVFCGCVKRCISKYKQAMFLFASPNTTTLLIRFNEADYNLSNCTSNTMVSKRQKYDRNFSEKMFVLFVFLRVGSLLI